MKAYQLCAINDLQYNDVPMPELQSGWCLIKVRAAGICSSDIPRIFSKGTYSFPTIPGHEFSGEVVKVADEKDRYWMGKKVGIFPLIPCMNCDPCIDHHYEMCEHYDYIGSRRDGAFAEYVAAPVWNLVDLPESINFKDAAMLEPLAVALHAVKRGAVEKCNSVGIIGTGMIGFAAAQWARCLGAENVEVVGRGIEKKEIADRLTGIRYITYSEYERLQRQYDLVIEAVGAMDSLQQAIKATKAGGRIVLMGNPQGHMTLSQDVYWRILRKQLTVVGTWNSAYESNQPSDWSEVVEAISENKIDVSPLVTHMYDQENLRDGLELMKNHTETYCKVMTFWNE